MKVETQSQRHTGRRSLWTPGGTPITQTLTHDQSAQIRTVDIGELGRAKAARSEGRTFDSATGLHSATRLHNTKEQPARR